MDRLAEQAGISGWDIRKRNVIHPGEVCPAKWQQGEKTLVPSVELVGKI